MSIVMVSCKDILPKTQGSYQMVNQKNTAIADSKGNVRFDFKASRLVKFKNTIEIQATLFNDNTDTVYFLTSTCDGMQYSLEYDSTKLILTPFFNCNANYPMIGKIPPNGKTDFDAHFRVNEKMTSIRLGFDFYQVDKSFDIKKIELHDVYYSPGRAKNMLWADTKSVLE